MALATTVTVPFCVVPPSGAVMLTAGGAEFSTVTALAADVVTLPASSVAFAVKLWLPFPTSVESQTVSNGAVESVAMRLPSTKISTLSTRRSSVAAAEIATVLPLTFEPAAGAPIETTGPAAWLPSE